MRAIEDYRFIRGNIPMTKRDIRVFIMDALDIKKGDICLDVGAGTGSISVEMALRGGEVDAIEIEKEGVSLIKENAENFGVGIYVINDMAPNGILEKNYNKIFIGGTKGNLEEIIDRCYDIMPKGGIIVSTFILLKNAAHAMEYMKDKFKLEATLISTANINKIGMMMGNNPIFLIRGVK